MSMHEVTFTADPESDDYETASKCLEPTHCAIWYECDEKGCAPTEDEEDEGEYTRHGRLHRYLDIGWCLEPVPGKEVCITRDDWNGSITDDLCDIWHNGINRVPGTYKVDIDYWGDGIWEANLVKEDH